MDRSNDWIFPAGIIVIYNRRLAPIGDAQFPDPVLRTERGLNACTYSGRLELICGMDHESQ
ncbi:hypothetical protein D3C76_1832050 [compost metagenome]